MRAIQIPFTVQLSPYDEAGRLTISQFSEWGSIQIVSDDNEVLGCVKAYFPDRVFQADGLDSDIVDFLLENEWNIGEIPTMPAMPPQRNATPLEVHLGRFSSTTVMTFAPLPKVVQRCEAPTSDAEVPFFGGLTIKISFPKNYRNFGEICLSGFYRKRTKFNSFDEAEKVWNEFWTFGEEVFMKFEGKE